MWTKMLCQQALESCKDVQSNILSICDIFVTLESEFTKFKTGTNHNCLLTTCPWYRRSSSSSRQIGLDTGFCICGSDPSLLLCGSTQLFLVASSLCG